MSKSYENYHNLIVVTPFNLGILAPSFTYFLVLFCNPFAQLTYAIIYAYKLTMHIPRSSTRPLTPFFWNFESRDPSQAFKSMIRVSSCPKLSDG